MNFNSRTLTLTLKPILIAAVLAQLLSAPAFWEHSSRDGDVLGLFSKRYLLVLALYFGVTLGWLAALILRKRVQGWLARPFPRGLLLVLTYAAVVGLRLTGFDDVIAQYAMLNWLLLALAVIVCAPDRPTVWRRWVWAGAAVMAALFVPVMITVFTTLLSSPDEAQYADMATSPFRVGGLYSRTWLREPYIIEPGKGWSLAAYGWFLENVWFDIKMGRIWNFIAYVLAFAGIGAVTARLYGRRAAAVSVFAAVFSHVFIPVVDYRPNHQLAAAAMWITFAALQARLGKKRRGLWHGLTGLMAALSMQLHTAGIVFVAGFCLFYAAEFGLNVVRRRPVRELVWPLLWFGVGLGIGSAIYYVFNIMLAGGLDAYLDFLVSERGERLRAFRYFTWPVLIEALLIVGGFAYILWRRRATDRLFAGMVASVLVGIGLLDTQGYRHHYAPLYFVPVGALIVHGLRWAGTRRGANWRSAAAAACIVGVLVLETVSSFVRWDTVGAVMRSGQLPTHALVAVGEALRPYINDDDVLVSTHQLLWGLPEHERLYSSSAERWTAERWGLSDLSEVWERVAPTVIVDIEGETDIRDGLREYMARHEFAVCEEFVVQGIDVRVYRERC